MSTAPHWKRLAMTVAVIGAASIYAAGEEPTPTPTPTPTPGTASDASLSDVAGGIELNKDAAGADGGIVISNENLATYAEHGRLTEVTRPAESRRGLADVSGDGAQIEGEIGDFAATTEKKNYWQSRYERQLERIRQIREQIDVLDLQIPGLWRDFYAWDDPAYRDGVIKPKLDQAVAQRQKLESDLQTAETGLATIKQQARRDGAQPGWFRGFDPLPTPKPTESVMPP